MQIDPIKGPKGDLPPVNPSMKVQEEKGPIDVKATPKEHAPSIESKPIVQATPFDEEDVKILNQEAKEELKREKQMAKDGFVDALSSAPGLAQEGLGYVKTIMEKANAATSAIGAVSAAGNALSLILTPIKMIQSIATWFTLDGAEKKLSTSPPVDTAKKEAFYSALDTPMKMKDTLWEGYQSARGENFREALLSESVTFEAAINQLMKIGVSIPPDIKSKNELAALLKEDKAFIKKIDTSLSAYDSRVEKMQEMLERRKKIEEKRSGLLEPEFKKGLDTAIEGLDKLSSMDNLTDKKSELKMIFDNLRSLGILDLHTYIEGKAGFDSLKQLIEKQPIPWDKIDEKTIDASAKELSTLISDKESFKSLLQDHVNHHESLSASSRNGLKAMSAAKVSQEKKLYTYSLAETLITGTFSIISAVVTLVGLIGTFSGLFTLPSLAVTILGAVGLSLSVGSMAAGGIHAYVTAPNRFKESLFSLRGIRKSFSAIPYHYRKLVFERALLKKKQHQIAVSCLSAKLKGQFPNELLEQLKPNLKDDVYNLLKKPELEEEIKINLASSLKKYTEEMEKLNQNLNESFQAYSNAAEKYESHRGALSDAGVKDFSRVASQADMMFQESKALNIVDALSLMHKSEGGGVDEMTRDALKNYTGIDLESLSEVEKKEFLTARSLIEREMKAFYGGTTEEVLDNLK